MTDTTTHDKIIEVAIKSFAERGYGSTSMREIAEELSITKSALYYHFPGKEEIFIACIRHSIGTIVESMEALAEVNETVWVKLRLLIKGMCDFSKNSPAVFTLFRKVASRSFDKDVDLEMLEGYFKRQMDATIKIMNKGIEDGELRDDMPVNFITAAISGMIHHTSGPKMKLMTGIDIASDQHIDNLITLLQEGFMQK